MKHLNVRAQDRVEKENSTCQDQNGTLSEAAAMKSMEKGAWPSLDKLPPSIVFQTAAFLQDDSAEVARKENLRKLVEIVESAAGLRLADFFEPSKPVQHTPSEHVHRTVAALAAFISIVECGLEQELRASSPALLRRFQAVREGALSNVRPLRAMLVAALANAFGAANGETPEVRLRRAIEMAKSEEPVYLGSFAHFAEEPDEKDESE